MKRLVLGFLLVLQLITSGAQTRHELRAGAGLPIYTVLGVALPDDLKSLGPCAEMGYRWLHPVSSHFVWYLGADLCYRPMTFGKSVYVLQDMERPLKGHAFNLPVGAGVRGIIPLGGKLSLYGDLGAGLNFDFGYHRNRLGTGQTNIIDGRIMDGYDFVETASEFSVLNSFSYLVNSIISTDFRGAVSTYFTLELGTTLHDRYNIGLGYANYGLVEVERSYSQSAVVKGDSYHFFNESGSATMVLSTLSLRVGYIF
ncbi:MAG: hypothetical protein HUJ94_02590 [Bacteroidales bacterium]|nr:hypothetical protein [Bacteroidales bacterium]